MVMFELTLFPLAFVMLPEVSLDLCMSPFHFNFHLVFTWNFTWSLHAKMGFAIHLELYFLFRLIFLHCMMIFFTFTWNFKMALDPPQFIIGFVLSLGIHLKFHLTTRSYNVILTSTWAFHLNFHLIPVVHLHMIFHVPSGFWEAKDPRMSQMLKECHRFASLFHSRKTWTQKRAQAQWSLWRPLFRLMFFHSFHCNFNSWVVMNSIPAWSLVSLGFPLSHACCHPPH